MSKDLVLLRLRMAKFSGQGVCMDAEREVLINADAICDVTEVIQNTLVKDEANVVAEIPCKDVRPCLRIALVNGESLYVWDLTLDQLLKSIATQHKRHL